MAAAAAAAAVAAAAAAVAVEAAVEEVLRHDMRHSGTSLLRSFKASLIRTRRLVDVRLSGLRDVAQPSALPSVDMGMLVQQIIKGKLDLPQSLSHAARVSLGLLSPAEKRESDG